ncbi:MAG: hypothetical protein M1820_000945 [Bogoriella megaspora]|nr:MAG: hypothetical protein M1820_000945 [Bogoriella megaspora]
MAQMKKIHVRNGFDKDEAYNYYPVLIIGAGESGIAMGCQLKRKLNFSQFRIFDRQAGIGGTWWINRYPGVACDIPTALYSFSFAPNYQSKRVYPSGPEFVEYLENVASNYQITDNIQCNTDIGELRWIDDDEEWEITIRHLVPGTGDLSTKERQQRVRDHGEESVYLRHEKARAKVVVSCVGILVEPNAWPESIPGLSTFSGEVIHSARWRKDVDLAEKHVVVLGAGCSAAQIVPKLLEPSAKVKSVTQIMRTPPWVIPRIQEIGGVEAYSRNAPKIFRFLPFLGPMFRAFLFVFVEAVWFTVFQEKNKMLRKYSENFALSHMKSLAPEKYHEMMTPKYAYGCKRRVFDQDWLASMNSPKFTLTTQRIETLDAKQAVLGPSKDGKASGTESTTRISADVIVLANGFEATRWLHPLKVYGRSGKLLQEVWEERGGPQAYMGTATDGFPNFFLVGGPNTFVGHTSVILASENLIGYILRIIKPVLRAEARFVEPKRDAEINWTKEVQQKLKKTVFSRSCGGFYKDENGWNSTMYPYVSMRGCLMITGVC